MWTYKVNFRNGKRVKRFVWLSPDLTELRWGPNKCVSGYSKHPVSDLSSVVYGPCSDTFQRELRSLPLSPTQYKDHLCLSLIGAKRTVDLCLQSEHAVKTAIMGFQWLILSSKPQAFTPLSEGQFVFRKLYHKLHSSARLHRVTCWTWARRQIREVVRTKMFSPKSARSNVRPLRTVKPLELSRANQQNSSRSERTLIISPAQTPSSGGYKSAAMQCCCDKTCSVSAVLLSPPGIVDHCCVTDRSHVQSSGGSSCETASCSVLSKREKDTLLRTFRTLNLSPTAEESAARTKHEGVLHQRTLPISSLNISVADVEKTHTSPIRVMQDLTGESSEEPSRVSDRGEKRESSKVVGLLGNQSFSLDGWAADLSKIEPSWDQTRILAKAEEQNRQVIHPQGTSRFRSPETLSRVSEMLFEEKDEFEQANEKENQCPNATNSGEEVLRLRQEADEYRRKFEDCAKKLAAVEKRVGAAEGQRAKAKDLEGRVERLTRENDRLRGQLE